MKHPILAFSAALALAACGSDSAFDTTSTTTLTQSEQAAIAGQTASESAIVTENNSNAATSGLRARAILSAKAQFEGLVGTSQDFGPETETCDEGGDITSTGSYEISDFDQNSNSFEYRFNMDQVYDACAFEDEENSNILTLTGPIESVVTSTFNFVADSFEMELASEGNLAVDGAANGDGNCYIKYTVDLDLNSLTEAGTATFSGEICGETFEETQNFSDLDA